MLASQNRDRLSLTGLFVSLAAIMPLWIEALFLRRNWSRLPERWAVHWGLGGADRWTTRSRGAVYFPLAIGAIFVFFALFNYLFIRFLPQTPHPSLLRRTRGTPILTWEITALFCLYGLAPLQDRLPLYGEMWIGLALIIFLTLCWLAYQGDEARLAGEGEPPPDRSHWHARNIYFNPDSKDVLVPNRFGWGWSLNFARPVSWLYLAGVAVTAVLFITASVVLQ